MSEIFVIADTHFGHQKIIEYCKRPWATAAEMDEALIRKWNRVIGPLDIVYHLGDFALDCEDSYRIGLLESLNGHIHLIKGNHDKPERLRNMRFATIADYAEITWRKNKIVLCHYPLRSWRDDGFGSWHLYGHVHGTLPTHGKSLDVGVDAKYENREEWQYRPINLYEIESYMAFQPSLMMGGFQGREKA